MLAICVHSESNMWSLQILAPIRNESLKNHAQWDYSALRNKELRAENQILFQSGAKTKSHLFRWAIEMPGKRIEVTYGFGLRMPY